MPFVCISRIIEGWKAVFSVPQEHSIVVVFMFQSSPFTKNKNMKKLIALTLIVVCLGCFSLGCGEAKKPEPTKPAETTTTDTADTGATDATLPATDTK